MSSDLDQLIEYGFEKERAQIALKQGGSLQNALDWLAKNEDKSTDQLKEEQAAAASEEPPELQPGEIPLAKSLRCLDCNKTFRTMAQAQFHGSKSYVPPNSPKPYLVPTNHPTSGHENFEESEEEIAPLTEEEKAAKLEALKAKLAAKRAAEAEQDKIDRKKNEQIRMKNTKESQDAKEELQKRERIKEAQAKKREKQEEAEARKRVLAKLEADKQERKRKAEMEKAARLGQAPPQQSEPIAAAPVKKAASEYTESRLALQTSNGRVMKSFPVDTTLFEVVSVLEAEGVACNSLTQNFPRKTWDRVDFGMTLKEAGLVPSAALVVK